MNIYLKEMKFHRKSLIIWCIGMVAMIGSSMGKYAGMSSSGQSMNDLLSQMPQSMQAIIGAGNFDVSTASGYYGILYMYLLLMGTIHAVMMGATILSKEERDKTVEFLFVKPLSRAKIITYKLLAALTNVVILTGITLLSSMIIVENYSNGEDVTPDIVITIAGMFILQLLFLLIGSGVAAMVKKPSKATPISTGILLMTFFLSIAIDLNEGLEVLKVITPFKYFEAKHVMYGGGFDLIYLILSFIFIAAFGRITYVFYKNKDLKV
jgi:ABC-2 type transport system permease protein